MASVPQWSDTSSYGAPPFPLKRQGFVEPYVQAADGRWHCQICKRWCDESHYYSKDHAKHAETYTKGFAYWCHAQHTPMLDSSSPAAIDGVAVAGSAAAAAIEGPPAHSSMQRPSASPSKAAPPSPPWPTPEGFIDGLSAPPPRPQRLGEDQSRVHENIWLIKQQLADLSATMRSMEATNRSMEATSRSMEARLAELERTIKDCMW